MIERVEGDGRPGNEGQEDDEEDPGQDSAVPRGWGRRRAGGPGQVVEQPVEIAPRGGGHGRVETPLELGLVEAPLGVVPGQLVGHRVALLVRRSQVGVGELCVTAARRIGGVPAVAHWSPLGRFRSALGRSSLGFGRSSLGRHRQPQNGTVACRPAFHRRFGPARGRAAPRPARRRVLFGDEQPRGEVEGHREAAEERQRDEGDPHQRRIDVEEFRRSPPRPRPACGPRVGGERPGRSGRDRLSGPVPPGGPIPGLLLRGARPLEVLSMPPSLKGEERKPSGASRVGPRETPVRDVPDGWRQSGARTSGIAESTDPETTVPAPDRRAAGCPPDLGGERFDEHWSHARGGSRHREHWRGAPRLATAMHLRVRRSRCVAAARSGWSPGCVAASRRRPAST